MARSPVLVLWQKTLREAAGSWLGCALLIAGFAVVFIWISSKVEFSGLGTMLGDFFLGTFEKLVGLPIKDLTSGRGRVALLFIHALVTFTCMGWAVARGSDVISGEIGRGTMEWLLAQPLPRIAIVGVHAATAALGALGLGLAAWVGTTWGLWLVTMTNEPTWWEIAPAALNLAAMTFAVAGIATGVSAWQRERWETIAFMLGFIAVELIIEVLGRALEHGAWLKWLTIFSSFEPQTILIKPEIAWAVSLRFSGALVAMALAGYGVAVWRFSVRDVPPPL